MFIIAHVHLVKCWNVPCCCLQNLKTNKESLFEYAWTQLCQA